MKFKNDIEIESLSNATTDTDRFIVSDGGTLKYRTGSQVLSDIGGQSALTNPVTGTGTTNYLPKFTGSTTLGNSQIFDNGTNVGIGTNTPSGKLDIIDPAGTPGTWTPTYKPTVFISNGGTNNSFYSFGVSNASGPTFAITNAGNVGIGTTSPASRLETSRVDTGTHWTLDRSGVDVGTIGASSQGLRIDSITGGSTLFNSSGLDVDFIAYSTGFNPALFIQGSSGKIGMGTVSPNYRLSIIDSESSSTNYKLWVGRQGTTEGLGIAVDDSGSYIKSVQDESTTDVHSLDFDVISSASGNHHIDFNINGSEKMRIDSVGNVGIGTTSPSQKLEVSFAGSVYGARFTRNDGAGSSLVEFANTAGVKSIIGYDAGIDGYKIGTPSASNLIVKQSGNVGIGTTSPSGKLDVIGNLYTSGELRIGASYGATGTGIVKNTAGVLSLFTWGDSTNIQIGGSDVIFKPESGSERMRITSTGNVLIGTTSDSSYKLRVNGTSYFDSTLTAGRITDVTLASGDIRNNLGNPTVQEMALFHGQFNNKFRFISPTSQEESTDGVNWTASSRASASQLGDLMIGEGQGTSFVAIPTGTVGSYGGYRLTWDVYAQTGYVFLNYLYVYNSTNGNTVTFKIEAYHNTNGWVDIASGDASNWPGHTVLKHSSIRYSANASQHSKVRITFSTTHNNYTNGFSLFGIEWFGGYPAGRRNIEAYDRNKNVTFPAIINSTGFVKSGGTSSQFLKADGSVDSTTYQATLINPVTGTGTTNYLPKFTGSTTLGNSQIFDNGTNVGIGTTSPGYKLDVNGSVNFTGFNINSINQITAGAYIEPIAASATWSRTSTTDEWVKIISVSGSPRRIRLSLNAGGDNTNMYDEFMISHSGYEMQTHIYRLPGSKYNTSKVAGIKVINPTGSTQEVWVKLYGMTTPPGTFTYSANVAVLDAATVAASSQAAEPTGTNGSSVLLFDTNNRNDYTTMSSGGGYFGGKGYFGGNVGIGTTSPSIPLSVLGPAVSGYTISWQNGGGRIKGNLYSDTGGVAIQAGGTSFNDSAIYMIPNSALDFRLNGSTRMYLNSSGNLGIGTTSPGYKLDVNGNIRGTGFSRLNHLICDSTLSFGAFTAGSKGTLFEGYSTHSVVRTDSARLDFYMGKTTTGVGTMMSLTDTGNVGIGTTSPSSRLHVVQTLSSSTVPMAYFEANSSTYSTVNVRVDNVDYGSGMSFYRSGTYDDKAVAFINGSTQVGSISINTSSTSYNTTSDYRLKENLTEITDGIVRLKQLKPKRFNFIGDNATVDGFVAHEAQEVVPEAVTGEKDAILPNGEPDYQGIDQAKLVPLLTAALQEAVAKIELLENRVQILENR